MPTKKIHTPIESGFVYHIYNRGNNHQEVFYQRSDYLLFLDKMKYFLVDYCNLYAYALLPNHYHILIRVREDIAYGLFSRQFANFILSYANRFNRKYNRDGSLFLRYFRRIKVDDEEYLKRLIFYINYNPVKHEITDEIQSYEFSSYRTMLSDKFTNLDRSAVFSFYGSKEEFISYHNYLHDDGIIKKLIIEDD